MEEDQKTTRLLRILVADDEHALADLLATFLILCHGDVQVAYDGLEAIRLARGFIPDVAILDINMPILDGYSVARQMRATPHLKRTKLIALSASCDENRCLEVGFDQQLQKPCDLQVLLERVDALGAMSQEIAEAG